MTPCRAQRFTLLGGAVDAITFPELIAYTEHAVRSRGRCLLANHNLHSLYLVQRDNIMQDFYRAAALTYIDGMPLVHLARMLGYHVSPEHRITLIDKFPELMEAAARSRWRVFYLGSQPGVAARGAHRLRGKYPDLQIQTHDGHFLHQRDGADNRRVLSIINGFDPDVLMVGMGMPLQEHWVMTNLRDLPPCVIFTSGATMDYWTGEIATPPAWASSLGLYWLSRLLDEPGRLWRRYLIEPWSLLPALLRDLCSPRSERIPVPVPELPSAPTRRAA